MFEIWVSTFTQYEAVCGYGEMRFNARFTSYSRALDERAWYEAHGYHVNILDKSASSLETVPG